MPMHGAQILHNDLVHLKRNCHQAVKAKTKAVFNPTRLSVHPSIHLCSNSSIRCPLVNSSSIRRGCIHPCIHPFMHASTHPCLHHPASSGSGVRTLTPGGKHNRRPLDGDQQQFNYGGLRRQLALPPEGQQGHSRVGGESRSRVLGGCIFHAHARRGHDNVQWYIHTV